MIQRKSGVPVHIPNLEDTAWAATRRRSQQPMGTRCLTCATAVGIGWALTPWDNLMQEATANATLKAEVLAAVNHLKKKKSLEAPEFCSEEFDAKTLSGYTLRRKMKFLPRSAFQKRFGHDPLSLNIPLDKLTDTRGEEVSGVILYPDSDDDTFELETFTTKCTTLTQILQPHGAQIRAKQASDFSKAYRSDAQKLDPKGFKTVMKASTVQLKIQEHEEAEAKKREEKKALANLVSEEVASKAAEEAAKAEETQKVESSDESDEPDTHNAAPGLHLLASSQVAPKGRGKGKDKEKGKSKKKKDEGKSKPAGGGGRGGRCSKPTRIHSNAPALRVAGSACSEAPRSSSGTVVSGSGGGAQASHTTRKVKALSGDAACVGGS